MRGFFIFLIFFPKYFFVSKIYFIFVLEIITKTLIIKFKVMKTQITKLENQVLNAIQEFTAKLFTSDNGNWAYVHEIIDNEYNSNSLSATIGRGVISSLIQKGILIHDNYSGYVTITENYYKETGEITEAGSPEIEFINLEVK